MLHLAEETSLVLCCAVQRLSQYCSMTGGGMIEYLRRELIELSAEACPRGSNPSDL